MSERSVLVACIKSREAWDSVNKADAGDDFSEQGRVVLDAVTAYYTNDETAKSVDGELLANSVARQYTNPKHKKLFTELVAGLTSEEANVSAPNVITDLMAMRREVAGNKLASALLGGRAAEITNLLADYQRWSLAAETSNADAITKLVPVMRGADLSELVAKEKEEGLIPILPKALNDHLRGGLRRGHHVIVFAQPEIGKTMFVINAVSGFLRAGLTVLYIGNEEPVEDLIMRTVGRLSGMTIAEIEADPARAEQLARERGYDNIIFAPLSPGQPPVIEALVREYKPDVVVLDQLRNLDLGEQNYTVKLEKAATAARNIAKRYRVVVLSVTQAGDSASNKDVLDKGDVDYSNTGIPAQADVMIGIGASVQSLEANRRVLTLCKNKRSGSHAIIPVTVEVAYNRIQGA
jgi:KaiC/GvpD/RAD55 family RecA-like ATPase